MLSNSTPVSIGPFVLEKQPYDPVADFTHIASIGSAPCVVMANPAIGINTIVDLENAARKSGNLQFGSGGPASIGHIYGEMMSRALGIKMTHVPYRGGAPMTTDLISGVIPVGIDVITAFVPFFKTGQIKPLAVTSAAALAARSRHSDGRRERPRPPRPRQLLRPLGAGEDAGRADRANQRSDQRGAGAARHQEAPARARRHGNSRHARRLRRFVKNQVSALQPVVKAVRVTL
jgi:hypothetical protein